MKQSVIIDIGSSKVLAMVVCPAADGAIIVQNAEERTYSGYRFGELPNAAALSDTLESIDSAALRESAFAVPVSEFPHHSQRPCSTPADSLLNPDRTASRNRTSIFCLSRRRISLRRKALR